VRTLLRKNETLQTTRRFMPLLAIAMAPLSPTFASAQAAPTGGAHEHEDAAHERRVATRGHDETAEAPRDAAPAEARRAAREAAATARQARIAEHRAAREAAATARQARIAEQRAAREAAATARQARIAEQHAAREAAATARQARIAEHRATRQAHEAEHDGERGTRAPAPAAPTN